MSNHTLKMKIVRMLDGKVVGPGDVVSVDQATAWTLIRTDQAEKIGEITKVVEKIKKAVTPETRKAVKG